MAAKKKVIKKKRENPKKITLETPIVKDYIIFKALAWQMRPETERTQTQFLVNHNMSENSVAALLNYERLIGFWSAVRKYRKKYIDYENFEVDNALFKITQGVLIQEMKYNSKTRELEPEIFEQPPDVRAIKLHKEVNGEYQASIEHKVTGDFQARFIAAAKKIDEGDDADGKKKSKKK